MLYTNNEGISLALAVWLATDDYDHSDDPKKISTTSLLKPIRQIVLAQQNKDMVKIGDIASMVASRIGTAIHTAIEDAWSDVPRLVQTLLALGYPARVANKIRINPTHAELQEAYDNDVDVIPVYMEIRSQREIAGWIVTGKFDFVAENKVADFKSTGTYGYMHGSNIAKYIQQGSIYRWLNPGIITSNLMDVHLIFTDWSSITARQQKDYPQSKLKTISLNLMPLEETEAYLHSKLTQINSLLGASQEQLPECTDEELWRKPDTYKYYKDPNKKTRSTKNFDNASEAYDKYIADGSVGEVVKFPGQVVHCKYCDVVGVCDQAARFLENGLLTI